MAENVEKLKQIPKWTRKYAQNRTLTVLVLIIMACLISFVFGIPVFLIWLGFLKSNIILAGVGIALLVPISIFYIIFISKFGGKNKGLIDQKVDKWIYGNEGTASMPMLEMTKKKKWVDIVVGIVYMACILGSTYLAMLDYIPVKYMLPIMALFVVPFGVYQYFIMRPRLGPVLLIFPILYAIHAILIIAGVPIFFAGTFAVPLNMFLILVYNFLAFIIGHLYSRYALKKLKSITDLKGEGADED
jgi:hypothetical protein